jgi:hypothetical protein
MRRHLLLILSVPLAVGPGCHQPAAQTPRDLSQRLGQPLEKEEGDEPFYDVALLAMTGAVIGSFQAVGELLGQPQHPTPAVAARMMDEGTTPDQRRRGIAELVTHYPFARHAPYTTRYRQLAQNDPDYTVRAMAIRALNISRDPGATAVFIAALDDPDELVRLEAAKGLANLPDPNSIQPLLRIVEGRRPPASQQNGDIGAEAKDVRIAAADALRHYRTLDVARTLVSALAEHDFGVAWQSRRSLIALTGRDLRYDQGAWLSYLAGTTNPFG